MDRIWVRAITGLGALAVLLAAHVALAQAPPPSGAYLTGYGEARDLWEAGIAAGTYSCDTPDDASGPFAADVEIAVVDAICNAYNPFHSSLWKEECTDGARDYVFGQIWTCTTDVLCEGFGDSAAEQIERKLCDPLPTFRLCTFKGLTWGGAEPDPMTPEACLVFATDRCRGIVVNLVEQRITAGDCRSFTAPLTYGQKLDIKNQCNELLTYD